MLFKVKYIDKSVLNRTEGEKTTTTEQINHRVQCQLVRLTSDSPSLCPNPVKIIHFFSTVINACFAVKHNLQMTIIINTVLLITVWQNWNELMHVDIDFELQQEKTSVLFFCGVSCEVMTMKCTFKSMMPTCTMWIIWSDTNRIT